MSTAPVDAYASTSPVSARGAAGRRRWPLLLIGASAGTATWSGWVGLGELTGFGVVHPLPGIWDSLTVNTAITLPIGVEAYAVYALAVATDARPPTPLAQRWAWASAAGALLLGMGGQIAYHLLEAHNITVAPWWVVALVSSLPVLVLGAASLLWHLAAVPVADPVVAEVAEAGAKTRASTPAASTPATVTVTASTPSPPTLPATTSSASGASTPGTAAAVSGPAATGPRALPRPTAAATREPRRPAQVTATVTAPSDEQILTAIDQSSSEPPSIRALMRTYGIGQTRATRLHRAANDRANSTTSSNHDEHRNPHDQNSQNTTNKKAEKASEEDQNKITTEEPKNKVNSSSQESTETESRNHTLASPTE